VLCLFERGVLFCVVCVIYVLRLIVVPLPPGKINNIMKYESTEDTGEQSKGTKSSNGNDCGLVAVLL
jgi:hypothetical protein